MRWEFPKFWKRIEKVIKHAFSFDAPPEKMSSFVGWYGETSKPFFEDCSEVKSSCLNSYINERYVARVRQLKTARGGVFL
jgi:hypothetical protein